MSLDKRNYAYGFIIYYIDTNGRKWQINSQSLGYPNDGNFYTYDEAMFCMASQCSALTRRHNVVTKALLLNDMHEVEDDDFMMD